MADQFVWLMWPWTVEQYPGRYRGLSAMLGVAPAYARNLMQGRDPLKPWHMRRLVNCLLGRIAEEQALLAQLREEMAQAERVRAMRPLSLGYTNGLQKWRREQMARKAGPLSED